MQTDIVFLSANYLLVEKFKKSLPLSIQQRFLLHRNPYAEYLMYFQEYIKANIPDMHENGYRSIFHFGLFCASGSQSLIEENPTQFFTHIFKDGIGGFVHFRLDKGIYKKTIFKVEFSGTLGCMVWFSEDIDVFFPELRRKYNGLFVDYTEFSQVLAQTMPFLSQIVLAQAISDGQQATELHLLDTQIRVPLSSDCTVLELETT